MDPCPHFRGDPDGIQWCELAEREHDTLARLKNSYDRILALAWDLEALADQMAAVCPDGNLVARYSAWKGRRNP